MKTEKLLGKKENHSKPLKIIICPGKNVLREKKIKGEKLS